MQKYTDVVQDVSGNAIGGASVTVTTTSGAAVTLYDDAGASVANPVTTDSTGEYSFRAPNGRYLISVSANGFTSESKEIALYDPSGATISVKDAPYNAKGDGVTDDTAAIEAAITAAGQNATVLWPAGSYVVSSEVDFNVAGQRHMGYGATVLKSGTFTGSAVLRVSAANVQIEGLTIDGADKADDGISTDANVCSGFRARNLTIFDCNYGITANKNSNVTIDGCSISATANYSIRAHNTATATAAYSDVRIQNCTLDRSDADPATVASGCILVRGDASYFTTGVIITGNRMIHATDPTSSSALCCEVRYVRGCVFSGNYAKDGSMLVSVALSSDVTIDGNTCEGQTSYGIEVAGAPSVACEDVIVSNNVIKGEGRLNWGIVLQGTTGSTRCSVIGNTIRSVVDSAIFVSTQWDHVLIANNSVYMDTASSDYAIFCQSTSGAIEHVVISGNVLDGTSAAKKAIYLDDVSYASITGNVIANWTENGVYLQADTAMDFVTITGNVFRNTTNRINTIGSGTFGNLIQAHANTDHRASGSTAGNLLDLTADVWHCHGTGAPEGVVTAGVGSVYQRRNGGAGATLYVKESGTSNTGWVAK